MKVDALIDMLSGLRKQHGNIEVMMTLELHVAGTITEETYHGDVVKVEIDRDHSSEDLFIRICGDDKE